MSPKLAVQISTALPQMRGIKYGDLLLGLKGYYIYVRLDQPGDSPWFLARLTPNTREAASPDQLRCALSEAAKAIVIYGCERAQHSLKRQSLRIFDPARAGFFILYAPATFIRCDSNQGADPITQSVMARQMSTPTSTCLSKADPIRLPS